MSLLTCNWKGIPAEARSLMKGKASTVALATAVGYAATTAHAAAVTINTTDIDAMFDAVNNHIIPKAGETVSAMPSLIIPLAFLVVLLMILFFVPDVLYSMLEVIKGSIRKGKK
jgi:hypothetical protein